MFRVLRDAIKQFIPHVEDEERTILIYGPKFSHGLDYAIDVTVIAPFQSRFMSKLSKVEYVGCVVQAGADDKMNHVVKLQAFIPFALDAFVGYSTMLSLNYSALYIAVNRLDLLNLKGDLYHRE